MMHVDDAFSRRQMKSLEEEDGSGTAEPEDHGATEPEPEKSSAEQEIDALINQIIVEQYDNDIGYGRTRPSSIQDILNSVDNNVGNSGNSGHQELNILDGLLDPVDKHSEEDYEYYPQLFF